MSSETKHTPGTITFGNGPHQGHTTRGLSLGARIPPDVLRDAAVSALNILTLSGRLRIDGEAARRDALAALALEFAVLARDL